MDALRIQQTGKVRVQPFIPCNELIGCREAGQNPPLLEPEDRAECTAEEHAFDYGKGHQTGREIRLIRLDPRQGPVRLALNARHSLDGPQNVQLLHPILNIRVNQQRICHGMNGLHHHLHGIEMDGFGDLDLPRKALSQILHNNAIASGKEPQNALHEMLFILGQRDPVLHILGQVEFFRAPEDGNVILCHLPEIAVFDGENDVAVGVHFEHGLLRIADLALHHGQLMRDRGM